LLRKHFLDVRPRKKDPAAAATTGGTNKKRPFETFASAFSSASNKKKKDNKPNSIMNWAMEENFPLVLKTKVISALLANGVEIVLFLFFIFLPMIQSS
jgi:hypothetical protein